MRFEWDEAKRAANLLKRGIDFDERRDYGEPRRIGIGHIEQRLHVLVFVLRGEKIRVISLRKANEREERDYVRFKGQA